MLKLTLACLIGLCSLASNADTINYQLPTSVNFARHANSDGTYDATQTTCYTAITGNSLPCATTPAFPSVQTAGGYAFIALQTNRPAGTQTMWGTWTFESNNLFTSNPAAHVAFLMRGVSTGLYNIGGAGYTVGGLEGFNTTTGSPCLSGPHGAPETWWALDDGVAGNNTWGSQYCSPVLKDNHPYTLVMQAANNGFAYWLLDGQMVISNNYVYNGDNQSQTIINEATGTTIGIVFADAPGTSWNFTVTNMAFGWF